MPLGFAPPAAADSRAYPMAWQSGLGIRRMKSPCHPGISKYCGFPLIATRGAVCHPVMPSTGKTTCRQAEDLQPLNKLFDLISCLVFTEAVTAERTVRSHRSTGTREAILLAAEWLFAERGMYAVSNRQISEARGPGNKHAA